MSTPSNINYEALGQDLQSTPRFGAYVYSKDQIGETVFTQFENLPAVSTGRKFYLSWSHYLKLMRIDNVDERHFYEIESVKNDWSLSELKRQYDSSLYERLALSTNKDMM